MLTCRDFFLAAIWTNLYSSETVFPKLHRTACSIFPFSFQHLLYLCYSSWFHLIQLPDSLLTGWTNESGPWNLISVVIEMGDAAGSERELPLPGCLLELYCDITSRIFIELTWNSLCTAEMRSMLRYSGNLPSSRLLGVALCRPTVLVGHAPWEVPHMLSLCTAVQGNQRHFRS